MKGWAREEERKKVASEPARVFDKCSFTWRRGKSGARKAGYMSWMPWPMESRTTRAVWKAA
jgi:hypothetical protein